MSSEVVRELTDGDIQCAFVALGAMDRAMIDDLVLELVTAIRARHRGEGPAMFGKRQALELLSKLGIWLVRTDRRTL